MKQNVYLVVTLLCTMLAFAACAEKPKPEPTGVVKPNGIINEGYLNTFETVWQTVNDTYFDSTFGGVDWNEVHDRYYPGIAHAENDQIFYERLNQMLHELNVSHMGVYRFDFLLNEVVSPYDFGQGSVGIDVRFIDGEAVIVSIKPGSSAERAGLQPGFIVHSIDGISIDQIAVQTYLTPRITSAIASASLPRRSSDIFTVHPVRLSP